MAKTGFKTVDAYIAAQPPEAQKALEKLRRILRKALPDAEEVISYQIPAYKLHGRVVLFFAGWRAHYSLYPAGSRLPDSLKKALASYELSRGTVRFELSKPIPDRLITRVAKSRAKEAAEKAKTKKPGKNATRRRVAKHRRG
jgi:uncharacterized protein YdhG (YjbR/CyaY superfamily)